VIESTTGARMVHDTLEQEGWSVEIADAWHMLSRKEKFAASSLISSARSQALAVEAAAVVRI
jgi:hypothetical protein